MYLLCFALTLVCDLFPYGSLIPYNKTSITIPKLLKKIIKIKFRNFNYGYFGKKKRKYQFIENTREDILNGVNEILYFWK